MKNLKFYLTALAISLGGVAVHANAASENHRGDSGPCYQLTPLAGKGALGAQAENGFSRTTLASHLERLAENGFSRTPLGPHVERLAEGGFSRTRLGMQAEALAYTTVAGTPIGDRLGAFAQVTSA